MFRMYFELFDKFAGYVDL